MRAALPSWSSSVARWTKTSAHGHGKPLVLKPSMSIPDALADEAERALTRSWQLEPTRSETARPERSLLSPTSSAAHAWQDATNLVESALDITPRSPPLLFLYGQILARRGEYDGARRALRSVRDAAADPVLRDARDRASLANERQRESAGLDFLFRGRSSTLIRSAA